MAKQNCGTCNRAGYLGSPLMAQRCNRGCICKVKSWDDNGLVFGCFPNVAQQNKDRHLNASGFLGTGVSGFKVIWWSLGALLLLSVVAKGVGIYKQAKY
tara:strand:+ start:639 stop:935 length:297 start_codon:yes stop_codon:yes gene_type:complete